MLITEAMNILCLLQNELSFIFPWKKLWFFNNMKETMAVTINSHNVTADASGFVEGAER